MSEIKKIQCKCGKEFRQLNEYNEHFLDVRNKIGKQKTEPVEYGVDNKKLEGRLGNDQLLVEVVADHQILRMSNEEYNRF